MVHVIVDLTVFQNLLDVIGLKQLRNRLMELDIQSIFQLLDLGGLHGNTGMVLLQLLHAHQQAVRHLKQRPGHGQQMIVGRDIVDTGFLHRGPGVISQIIDGGRETVQVVPVNGSDESTVDIVHQFPANIVRFLFLDLDEITLFLGGILTESAKGFHSVANDLCLPNQKSVEIETFFPFKHRVTHLFVRKS